jgi:hypothetical protein
MSPHPVPQARSELADVTLTYRRIIGGLISEYRTAA